MTIYLTKIDGGKTHHFRATCEDNGVNIIHGIFYKWLEKYFEGCGDRVSAIERQNRLINEKLSEGFKITEFKEIPENTVEVYDKAKWHFGGDFPPDLEIFQGYIHTGMFLGWLIDNDLVSDEFKNNNINNIKQFKLQKLTGSQVFESSCDGVLTIEDISELGNNFALQYFDFDTGKYISDYQKTLCENLPSLYHVVDNWDNYIKLKQVFDKRFLDWKNQNKKKTIWKFW